MRLVILVKISLVPLIKLFIILYFLEASKLNTIPTAIIKNIEFKSIIFLNFFINKIIKKDPNKNKTKGILFPENKTPKPKMLNKIGFSKNFIFFFFV